MDWRIRCGGPTEEEIRTTILTDNSTTSSTRETALQVSSAEGLQIISQIQSAWRCQINEFYDVQLREQYIVTSGISALEWDRIRDQVVFIHDGLTAADLAEHLEQYRYSTLPDDAEPDFDEDEYNRIRDELTGQLATESPRTVFLESITSQTTTERHKQLGTLSEPVAADVWQAPQFDSSGSRLRSAIDSGQT